jgi:hypothetical protein
MNLPEELQQIICEYLYTSETAKDPLKTLFKDITINTYELFDLNYYSGKKKIRCSYKSYITKNDAFSAFSHVIPNDVDSMSCDEFTEDLFQKISKNIRKLAIYGSKEYSNNIFTRFQNLIHLTLFNYNCIKYIPNCLHTLQLHTIYDSDIEYIPKTLNSLKISSGHLSESSIKYIADSYSKYMQIFMYYTAFNINTNDNENIYDSKLLTGFKRLKKLSIDRLNITGKHLSNSIINLKVPFAKGIKYLPEKLQKFNCYLSCVNISKYPGFFPESLIKLKCSNAIITQELLNELPKSVVTILIPDISKEIENLLFKNSFTYDYQDWIFQKNSIGS